MPSPIDYKAAKEPFFQPVHKALKEQGYTGYIVFGVQGDNSIDAYVEGLGEDDVYTILKGITDAMAPEDDEYYGNE